MTTIRLYISKNSAAKFISGEKGHPWYSVAGKREPTCVCNIPVDITIKFSEPLFKVFKAKEAGE